MKAASLNDVKKELTYLEPENLRALCIRLARYKKENKELLTYLLFESHDEQGYITGVKNEMDGHFEALPKTNIYLIKKMAQRIYHTYF